jgi:hypothetical protein
MPATLSAALAPLVFVELNTLRVLISIALVNNLCVMNQVVHLPPARNPVHHSVPNRRAAGLLHAAKRVSAFCDPHWAPSFLGPRFAALALRFSPVRGFAALQLGCWSGVEVLSLPFSIPSGATRVLRTAAGT